MLPLFEGGGWAVVSYRPDRLDATVLHGLHHCLLTRMTEPEAMRAIRGHCKDCGLEGAKIEEIPMGSALLCGGQVVKLRPAIRHVPHVRHLFKYLDIPLPAWKRFWFRDEEGGIGAEAASLYEFMQILPSAPIESLEYHDRRQDFVRWAEGTLGDEGLAARLRKLSNRQLKGEELRTALRQTVANHYKDLSALR